MIKLSQAIAVEAHELTERFVRASGPGGQKVNKVATAVELRFNIQGSSLAPEIKARLTTKLGSRISSDGVLIIDSREYRTQWQNRIAARIRLAKLLEQASRSLPKRLTTKPRPVVLEKRRDLKRRRGQVKKLRGWSSGKDD